MNKLILCSMLLATSSLYAQTETKTLEQERLEWAKDYFAKQGEPGPDGGVQVIPQEKMSSFKQDKHRIMQKQAEVAKFGYVKEIDPEADTLFNIKNTIKYHFKQSDNNYDPTSTHLRHSINDLKMAYTFNGVPQNDVHESIGFSPYLSYIKNQGWVGAAQFFVNNEIGTCVFSENNVRLSHGSVIVAKEHASTEINGKTTVISVMGTEKNGFVYGIDWYDSTFFRNLKCANKQFSENLKSKTIELAKRIDLN